MKDIFTLKNISNEVFEEIAMAKTPTGGETHQRESAGMGHLLFPGLRKIFFATYAEKPEQYSQIFHVKNSTKSQEKDVVLGAMTAWGKHGGTNAKNDTEITGSTEMPSVVYEKMKTDEEIVYKHTTFSKGFEVEKELIEDEQYDTINKFPKELARAGRATVETDAISVLNNGFPTDGANGAETYTNSYVIYDGKSLFSAKHQLGEDSTKTCSNYMIGELSDANLVKALELGSKTVDEAGKKILLNFDTLIVPRKLEHQALRLVNSTQVAGTNNNDTNSLKGRFKVVVNDYLTSDANWFLQDSDMHELNFFWRKRPNFQHMEDFDTFVYKYNGRMRYSYGASNWRGIIGVKAVSDV